MPVLSWLLEGEQPSVRYLTLTTLLGRSEGDSSVRAAKRSIGRKGWAAEILARQRPGGTWVEDERLYRPKYVSTNWMLLVLADLGLNKTERKIARSFELWIKRFAKKDGGFATENMTESHLCMVGNTARALVKFGYADHPKVRSALDWLVRHQSKNGGWSCFGSRGDLDSWEGISAFAAYPRQKWSRSVKNAVERGAEFFLEKEMHRQGARYGPWYRFHYPVYYYYDLLVGLDFITALGYGKDRRLNYALSALRKKRRPDGRWNLNPKGFEAPTQTELARLQAWTMKPAAPDIANLDA